MKKNLEILDDESESFIALSMNGQNFRGYAVSNLLRIWGCYTPMRSQLLISCLTRQDKRAARIFLQDWRNEDRMPKIKITKFIPGEHFHVLNTKFDSLGEAQYYAYKKDIISVDLKKNTYI